MKEKIEKLNFNKIKNFREKNTVKRKRRQDTDCDEIFAKYI